MEQELNNLDQKKRKSHFFIKLLILIWIVFSIGYVAWDIYNDFKKELVQKYVEQGRQEGIKQGQQTCASINPNCDAKTICQSQTQDGVQAGISTTLSKIIEIANSGCNIIPIEDPNGNKSNIINFECVKPYVGTGSNK